MQRTGRSVNGEEEDYLLDLTRGYHNLLGIQKNESGQRFYFDGNVAAMEETTGKTAGGRIKSACGAAEERRTAFSGLHYYLQDELGSPLRVSGYGEGADIPGYLTYGYDEFGNDLGNDLGRELEEEGIPDPYDRQGEEQPFGYTGYRYDGISGTYFAQAREYKALKGKFVEEDKHWNVYNNIYGDNSNNTHVPNLNAIRQSANLYVYCINNPVRYIDLNGSEAGDPFKSRDDAAIDFAETIGGKSIEENLEYAAYIYSWEEEKHFLFIKYNKTYYSYTEPFTSNMKGHVKLEPYSPPIPEGTRWEAAIHTHGAWEAVKNEDLKDYEKLNDAFSPDDKEYAELASRPFYLASSNGQLQVFDPTIGAVFKRSDVVKAWKLPHDKNHPELPSYHSQNCENCYAAE